MFTVPRVNGVSSDEGFSVEVLGRTGIKYCEGDKSMFVDAEVLAPGYGIAVFQNSIKSWLPPHEGQQIDESERQRILENIRRAVAFENEPVEIL